MVGSSWGWAHRAPGSGAQQRWGWLLWKEQKQQAAGLVPRRSGGQYLEAPVASPHPPCGTHTAFNMRVIDEAPS